MKKTFFPTVRRSAAVAAGALVTGLASVKAALAGPIADIGGSVDFGGMTTDIQTLAPTILGYVVAIGTVWFVIRLVRGITRGG